MRSHKDDSVHKRKVSGMEYLVILAVILYLLDRHDHYDHDGDE